jgi:hypothetical protein
MNKYSPVFWLRPAGLPKRRATIGLLHEPVFAGALTLPEPGSRVSRAVLDYLR